jgi:hypothetical protein
MDRVQDGRITIKVYDLPTFLYNDTVPYNRHAINQGLFKGYYFLRVHLFPVFSYQR